MDELEERTMHVFIARALKKVLKEAPKKHVQLRQACVAVIGQSHARCRIAHATARADPAAEMWAKRVWRFGG